MNKRYPWERDTLSGLTDEELDHLGDLYIEENITAKYGVSFIEFVELKHTGKWEGFRRSKDNNSVIGTKLNVREVKPMIAHSDPEVRSLASDWVEKFDEVENGAAAKENILKPASALLTLDSQLCYLLENIEGGER